MKAVYSGIIFAQLVCGTWFTAASLFQMDMVFIEVETTTNVFAQFYLWISSQAAHHLDVYFSSYVNSFTLSITNLYLYCYSGATVAINWASYSTIVFEKEWYLMPVEQQKLLIPIIRTANVPMIFSGYNILILDVETFLSVSTNYFRYVIEITANWFMPISDPQIGNELLFDV